MARHILSECERGDQGRVMGEEVESPLPSSPSEEVDLGKKQLTLPERPPQREGRRKKKRPGWLQVLLGRHWEHILKEGEE